MIFFHSPFLRPVINSSVAPSYQCGLMGIWISECKNQCKMTTIFVAVTTNCYNANLTWILHVGNSLLIKVCQRDTTCLHLFLDMVYWCCSWPDSSWDDFHQGCWHWEGSSLWGPGRTEFLKSKPANLRSRLMMVVMSQGCSDGVNLPLKCCWTLVICAVSKPLCSEKWVSQRSWELCSPIMLSKEPGLQGFQKKGFVQFFLKQIKTQPGAILEGH